jgi:hypothetical protein
MASHQWHRYGGEERGGRERLESVSDSGRRTSAARTPRVWGRVRSVRRGAGVPAAAAREGREERGRGALTGGSHQS